MSDNGDLGIVVKVAVAEAVAAMQQVQTEARKSEQAFTSFGNTFARIGRAQQLEADSLSKIKLEALSSTNALKGLSEQMGREAVMLDKIHGPAKRFAEDLQTLDMLHKRGLISAQEYTAQLEKMGQVHGPKKEDAGSAPSGGVIDAAMGAGLGVAAGAVGLLSAGIKDVIGRWYEHKQATIDASNALLKFYDTAEQANGSLREQQELADQLHVRLGVAVESYGAVREASEGLYLTSQQQVAITRTLAEIMDIDGKSMGGITDVMSRLQYAMSVGNLEFRDLKAITKEYPDTAAAFSAATGKSIVQLEAMAKAGKFNASVIKEVFTGLEHSTEIHKKHREVLLSADDIQKRMNVSTYEAIKIYGDMRMKTAEAEEAYVSLDEAALRLANHFLEVQDNVKKATIAIQTGQAIAALGFGGAAASQAAKDLATQKRLLEEIRKPAQTYREEVQALKLLWRSSGVTNDEYAAELKKIEERYHGVAAAAKEAKKATEAWADYRYKGNFTKSEDVEKYGREYGNSDHPYSHEVGAEDMKPIKTETWDETLAKAKSANDELEKMGDKMREVYFADRVKKFNDEQDKTKKRIEDIATGLKPVEDAFDRLFTTGTFGWKQMLNEMAADLARFATHQAFVSLISALAGSGGGGLNSSISSKFAGLSGGHHAFGGDYTAPWTGGGQDSVPVMFRMSPGEHVQFTPQGSGPQGGGSAPPQAPMQAIVEYHHDPRALRIGDPNAVRFVLDVARQYPGMFSR